MFQFYDENLAKEGSDRTTSFQILAPRISLSASTEWTADPGRLFAEVMALNLVHVGKLSCELVTISQEQPEIELGAWMYRVLPKKIKLCAGTLRPDSQLKSELCQSVECDGSCCGLRLVWKKTRSALQHLLLHLMLKQMVPQISPLYYLECHGYPALDNPMPAEEISKLGTLAVDVHNTHCYFDNAIRRTNIAFMLNYDMRSRLDCAGYDSWLQFLVDAKFNQLKEAHAMTKEMILGPR